jgi:hypothetical protein
MSSRLIDGAAHARLFCMRDQVRIIVAVACNDNSAHRTNSGAIRVRASRKRIGYGEQMAEPVETAGEPDPL